MKLEYKKLVKTIIERLITAHDPAKAKIRKIFFQKEYEFFKKHIKNQIVLIAGSGLGHDSFELVKQNKKIIGIELLQELVEISKERLNKLGFKNIEFQQGDFTKLKYSDNYFNSAILNMGTIGDFEDKIGIVEELLRVANVVYLDFYPPTKNGLQTRKKMYEEEKWQNVRIEGDIVVSDDGLFSKSISKKEISKIAELINAKVEYHSLCDFAIMAELKRK